MNRLDSKIAHIKSRRKRVRSNLFGTKQRPRLSVNISLRHVSAQLINDEDHHTMAYASSVGNPKLPGNLTLKAEEIGTQIAKKAKKLNIDSVVFDRGSKRFSGRVKALADNVIKEGVKL